MTYRNVEKAKRAAKREREDKERKYVMRELIEQTRLTNYILICIGAILIGIFVRLTIGS